MWEITLVWWKCNFHCCTVRSLPFQQIAALHFTRWVQRCSTFTVAHLSSLMESSSASLNVPMLSRLGRYYGHIHKATWPCDLSLGDFARWTQVEECQKFPANCRQPFASGRLLALQFHWDVRKCCSPFRLVHHSADSLHAGVIISLGSTSVSSLI